MCTLSASLIPVFSGFISSSFCLLLIAGRSVSFFSMSQSPFPSSYFYSYLWRRSWPLFSLYSFLLCSLFSVQFWRISGSVSTVSGRDSLVACYFSFTSAIRSQFFFSLVFLNVDHPCWSLNRLCFYFWYVLIRCLGFSWVNLVHSSITYDTFYISRPSKFSTQQFSRSVSHSTNIQSHSICIQLYTGSTDLSELPVIREIPTGVAETWDE